MWEAFCTSIRVLSLREKVGVKRPEETLTLHSKNVVFFIVDPLKPAEM